VPKTVPTLCRTRLFHRIEDCLLLRVNLTLRDVHVAVSGLVGKRPCVWRPPGETGMPPSGGASTTRPALSGRLPRPPVQSAQSCAVLCG
jgi:hypothetical protein